MSSPINISGQTTPPANAGQGGVASSNKIGSAEFGSLFAVLLGLTAPSAEGTKTTATTTAPTVPGQPANPEISAELLNLQASLNTQAAPGEQDPTITKALTDLLAAIEKLANAETAGEPVDPELVAIATAALETLAAALPATSTAVAAAAATTGAAGSTSPLPLLDAEQSQAPILPQSANTENKDAGSAKPAATEAAKPTAESQALLAKLTQIADKLSEPLPALADKLQQLAQKLTDLAPTTTARNIASPAPTTSTTPTTSLEGEIANTVSTLFGSKEVGTPKTTQAGAQAVSASAEQSAPVEETSTKATGPTRTLTGAGRSTENNIPGAQVERGTPQATPGANSAALLAATTPVSQTTAATEADPLLYIQSNGQLAMRGEALGGIKAATAPYQQPSQNLNLPHIAFEFARNVQAGVSRFQIRLNPPEMGKIDVKMDIDSTGALNARLTVERPETLDILQRDARALERALSQAGLDSSRTNLEFTLKQNPFSGQDSQFAGGDEQNSHSPFAGDDGDEPMTTANIPGAMMYSGTASPGGINMLA